MEIHNIEFKNKAILLDDFKLKFVEDFKLEKTEKGMAELSLKLLVKLP